MFKILDGRDEFYQWDLERKLVVADSTIKQVHFCNRFGNCSLIRATYEVNGVTVVNVPNIILQESFNLHVYGYDVNYTKFDSVFNIVPRTKPENYINTEEELKVWDELEQKVIDLENKVDGEGIQAAVKQYLTDNPPQAGATTEEAAQIEQNKQDIAQLRQDFDNFEVPEVSLEGYATEKYVDDAIANIDIPEGGGSVDLTGYATEKYVDDAVAAIDIPDVSGFALKTEIPSTAGLATEAYVDETATWLVNEKIPKAENFAPAEHEHEEYQTADEVQALIDASVGSGSGGGGGSVAVDGKTIVENADGTISTTIGGGRTLITPEEVKYTFNNPEGITTKGEGWSVFEFSVGSQINVLKRYRIQIQLDGEWYETEMFRKGTTQHFDLAEQISDLQFYELDYISNKYQLVFNASSEGVYQTRYLTDVIISQVAEYEYEPIGANYVPIADGLRINDASGLLETPIGNHIRANGQNIVHNDDGNRNSLNVDKCTRFIGLGDNTYSSTTNNGGNIIGANNTIYAAGYDNNVLGFYNRVELRYSSIIGNNNNKDITASGVGNAQKNYIFGEANTWNVTNSYYPQGTTLIGVENNITKMNARNSVLIGYQNSLRSSSNPQVQTHTPVFYFGQGLSNVNDSSTTQGQYHIDCAVGKFNQASTLENIPFVVGMGTADSAASRKNGLTINSLGNLSTLGGITNSGADYAEYFEWLDGNPEAEDRVGYAVALEGNKIRIANAEDDIIGFISGTAMAIGEDAPWHWNGRFMKDEFGRVQFEEKEFEESYTEIDEEGNEVVKTYTVKKVVEVQNPEWNPEQEYIPRKARAEWDTVGLLGKLYVRDDGSCEVGGYAAVADGGIVRAASAKTNMRVLERTSENIVRVLFK